MQYKIIVDKQPSSNPSDERKEYTIDIEELRVKGSVYDSINITPDRTYVTRRLTLSEYGVLSELVPSQEEDLGDLNIELFEGDNYIYLYEMTGNRFCAEYVVKNDFTDDFATKNEMNSAITQTAQNIELSVNQKLTGYSTTEQMNAAIQLSANSITSTVSKTYATKTELTTAKSEIKQTTDSITSTVSQKVGKTEIISSINQSAEQIQINANKINLEGKEINLTGDNINIKSNNFNVDNNGNLTCNNATMSNVNINSGDIKIIEDTGSGFIRFSISSTSEDTRTFFTSSEGEVGSKLRLGTSGGDVIRGFIHLYGNDGLSTNLYNNEIQTPKLTQTSLESIKKNIAHYNENALETILNSDIYSYNLKTEKDTDKKHIGFVIGDKYKTPKEVMNNEGNAIELYSCIGILWKAMQELYNKVEVS